LTIKEQYDEIMDGYIPYVEYVEMPPKKTYKIIITPDTREPGLPSGELPDGTAGHTTPDRNPCTLPWSLKRWIE
jgi:hypothetical protein